MKRHGTSEEMVEPVAFLATDRGAYRTGQNTRIDVGIMRQICSRLLQQHCASTTIPGDGVRLQLRRTISPKSNPT
ncbi:hypothetical protein [Ensifer adhaerens]|uniref:hypothetical protein n=1 Tax=Ensifer adhaerens TaxID=106592 RepID=UPI001568B159